MTATAVLVLLLACSVGPTEVPEADCAISQGTCQSAGVLLDITPRPVRAMRELSFAVSIINAQALSMAEGPMSPDAEVARPAEKVTVSPDAGSAMPAEKVPVSPDAEATRPEEKGTMSPPVGMVLDLSMPGMNMGINRIALVQSADGTYRGGGVIPRCPSGQKLWRAGVLDGTGREIAVYYFEVR